MTTIPSHSTPDAHAFGQNLMAARTLRGLSQKDLASRCGLSQVQVSYFETGRRWPTLPQLTKLAQVLEISLSRLLAHDPERLGIDLREFAFELRNLGIVDLRIANATVPGAFRPAEQVISLALAGDEPEPRIVEAIPAVLAWNPWSLHLLRAYGRIYDSRVHSRIAWLADIVLTIDRTSGFPGGVLQSQKLSRLLKSAKPSQTSDSLGRPAGNTRLSPVWKRWNITYAGNLTSFRDRAHHLYATRKGERFWQMPRATPNLLSVR